MLKKLMEIKKELEKNGIQVPVDLNLKLTKTGIEMNLSIPYKKISEIALIQDLKKDMDQKPKDLPKMELLDQKE